MNNQTREQAVRDHMAPTSQLRAQMPEKHFRLVYLLGNGFGDMTLRFAMSQDWDFSHVRDSDSAGYARMADKLEELGYDLSI